MDSTYSPRPSSSAGGSRAEFSSSGVGSNIEASQRSRKRRRHQAATGLSPSAVLSPPKRQRRAVKIRYLDLINEDIEDAASGIVRGGDDDDHLKDTQIGAVTWSVAEKRFFFTALARLGRDDTPGIAARIVAGNVDSNKSSIEVRQYLVLLAEAERAHLETRGGYRPAAPHQAALRPIDVPAAVEISPELCAALEAAADGLILSQEAHEAKRERERWGGRWLVTPPLARVFERRYRGQPRHRDNDDDDAGELPPFAELFSLRTWLLLSEHVFMNSSVADGNWQLLWEARSENTPSQEPPQPPSIRATALADFYALVLSVTRRLVAAALFVASSRLRARRGVTRKGGLTLPLVVKRKDVQAAAASVGLEEHMDEFWARAARRLRLDVYNDDYYDDHDNFNIDNHNKESATTEAVNYDDDDDDDDYDDDDSLSEGGRAKGVGDDADYVPGVDSDSEDDDSEGDGDGGAGEPADEAESISSDPRNLMTYDEVEAALGFPRPQHPQPSYAALPDVSSTSSEEEEEEEEEAESTDDDSDDEEPGGRQAQGRKDADDGVGVEDGDDTYPPLNPPSNARARHAIQRWHAVQARLEADADRFDARAREREEAQLRAVLGSRDLSGLAAPGTEGGEGEREEEPEKRARASGIADPEGLKNWRDHVEFYSEWEVVGPRRGGGARREM